ncbi:MAG: SRPBCC family protein [Actinophytocola sp.]|nr:SRPBCC family protein [Actinophytocola sp.]
MVHIQHTSTCKAPIAVAFGYIDDYRTAPEWMFGLSKFEPIGDKDHGLGAVYDGSMKLGPKTLHSTVEVTGWEQDKLIALDSIKGFVNQSTWQFLSRGPEETELKVDFTYELPGGMAGKALGRVIEPVISIAIKHTEHTLRDNVERLYAKR